MLQYSLEVAICWSIFYIIYIGFLRRETFFTMNRFYIMGSLVTGIILPLIKMIELPAAMREEAVIFSKPLYFIATGPSVLAHTIEPVEIGLSWQLTDFILLIYIIGFIFMSFRLFSGLQRIYKLYQKGKKERFTTHTMVYTDVYHLPFSFMNCVFFSQSLEVNHEIKNILKHELTHIKSRHTIDVLFLEILNVMFWWNPLIYLFKKELRQIHEFLADAMVLHDSSQELYGRLLLSKSSTGIEIALTHSFFHSHLKHRFMMMYKKKSKRHAMLKYLVALPIVLGLVFMFSSLTTINELSATDENLSLTEIENGISNQKIEKKEEQQDESKHEFEFVEKRLDEKGDTLYYTLEKSNHKNIPVYKKTGIENEKKILSRADNNIGDPEKIFKVVDQMPLFANCTEDEVSEFKELKAKGQSQITNCGNSKLLEFVYQNLKYPKEARILGIEGMSVVQFVIEKDGSISDIKVVRDIGGGTSQAVTEMLELMNDTHRWIPGVHQGKKRRVLFTLPVRFKLEGGELSGPSAIAPPPPTTAPNAISSPPPPPSFIPAPPPPPKNFGDNIFKVVDQMPRFPGCESMDGTNDEKEACSKEKLLSFVYSNLRYPEEARIAGIQGMNVVQFIIEPDGSIQFTKMIRNVGGGTDEATMKMMNKMMEMKDKWTPGYENGKAVRVQYTLPVRFKLEDKDDPKILPLIILDGKNIGRVNDFPYLQNIDPNEIESISVLKGEKANNKYGEKGRFGVLEIITKNGNGIDLSVSKDITKIHDRDSYHVISNNLAFEDVNIFPNPAIDILNVGFKTVSSSDIKIELIDIEGKVIQSESISHIGDQFERQIPISNLSPNMFIIRIEQDGKVYSTPFLKTE